MATADAQLLPPPGKVTAHDATTIKDVPPDVLSSALLRLDGRSLAAACCSTSLLRSVAGDDALWRSLCQSTWPSLCRSHCLSTLPPRRLFADAFPFPVPLPSAAAGVPLLLPNELVSAVDVYYDGVPFLSRVVETPTSSPQFLTSPFCIEALGRSEKPGMAPAGMTPERMELSWILINPATGRAVNLSSRKAVMVEQQWYTEETVARFAIVVEEYSVAVAVTWSEELGHVREVSLVVEGADATAVSGGASLQVLDAAMNGARTGSEGAATTAMMRYDEFVRMKKMRKGRKARREAMADFCCSAVGAAIILAVVVAVLCPGRCKFYV